MADKKALLQLKKRLASARQLRDLLAETMGVKPLSAPHLHDRWTRACEMVEEAEAALREAGGAPPKEISR